MKKISALLASLILVLMVSSTFAETPSSIIVDKIVLPGVEYFDDMPIIESQEQMNYNIELSSVMLENRTLSFTADILKEGETVETFVANGEIFYSEVDYLQKRNVATVLLNSPNETVLLSCLIYPNADTSLFFPACSTLEGKNVITLILMTSDNIVLNFIGEIPNFLATEILNDNLAHASKDKEIAPTELELEKVTDEVEVQTETEAVNQANNYQEFAKLKSVINNTDIDEDEVKTEDFDPRIRASASSVNGIPATVFNTRGVWQSTNNKKFPTLGYYAETGGFAGTVNNATTYIQWEYIYNSATNDITASNTTTSTTAALRVHDSGYYVYNKGKNTMEKWDSNDYYRLKSGTILAGINSPDQILTCVQTSSLNTKSGMTVNWKPFTGLLPAGKVFNTAYDLFTAVQYREDRNMNKEGTMSSYYYQDTVAKQKSTYKGLIKTGKIALEQNYLSKGGGKIESRDHITLLIQVTQPSDLKRNAKTHTVWNKYYFEVYGKGAFSQKKYAVTEYRDSSYRVR